MIPGSALKARLKASRSGTPTKDPQGRTHVLISAEHVSLDTNLSVLRRMASPEGEGRLTTERKKEVDDCRSPKGTRAKMNRPTIRGEAVVHLPEEDRLEVDRPMTATLGMKVNQGINTGGVDPTSRARNASAWRRNWLRDTGAIKRRKPSVGDASKKGRNPKRLESQIRGRPEKSIRNTARANGGSLWPICMQQAA